MDSKSTVSASFSENRCRGANTVRLFGLDFNALSPEKARQQVCKWLTDDELRCRVVVTPNVDHVVQMQKNTHQKSAYQSADLVVADGWPIVAVSRLLCCPLPGRVAGSDMVPALLAEWSGPSPLRVFLLGAAPGVAELAAKRIHQDCAHSLVCGTYSPPLGFENDPRENERIIEILAAAQPSLLIVGLGAPKQEIWLQRFSDRLRAKVAIAAGGTIDFLAGRQTRAPRWVQRIGMEWFFRLATDPRRLTRRYLYDAWVFPQIVLGEFFVRITRRDKSCESANCSADPAWKQRSEN